LGKPYYTCKKQAVDDSKAIDEEPVWKGNLDLLRSIIVFLDTPNDHDESEELGNDDSLDEVKPAVLNISDIFPDPLETKGVDLSLEVKAKATIGYGTSLVLLKQMSSVCHFLQLR
jgi:hypothetical protein